jgi:hypothetical protein
MKEIHLFKNGEGIGQANFLRSLLECYGADEGSRLPLGSVLTCVT